MIRNTTIRQVRAKIEANCTQIPREKGHHSTTRTRQAIQRPLTGGLIDFREFMCQVKTCLLSSRFINHSTLNP